MFTAPHLMVLCAFAAWIIAAPAGAAEWQAGFASVKITPDAPVPMAGYASRNRPSEGVLLDLHAKVLALADANGARAVWITTDLIGLRAAVTDAIVRRIIDRTGLERRQILINASHTHTGPAIAETDTVAYGLDDESAQRMRAYRRALEDRIVSAVERALARMEPVELSHGAGVVPFVMNRREHTRERGIILGVNPRGPVDRTMPLLKVATPDGRTRAVVFGAATHNTTLTGNEYRISGDYAGFAQEYVERQIPGVQAMFVLGFAGDSNPFPRGTVELAREHGETLGREVMRVLETKLVPVRSPLNVQFDSVDLPLAPAPAPAELKKMTGRDVPGWQSWMAARMREALDRGEKLPAHYRAPLAVWQFGPDLTLVALPGEVVVDYAPLIEQAIGPLQLWLSGYNNDVFGYFPSVRVLAEGGYETRGVVHGGPGFFAPAAQDALIAKVKELARKAGRRDLPSTSGSAVRGIYGGVPQEILDKGVRLREFGVDAVWLGSGSITAERLELLRRQEVQVYAEFNTLHVADYLKQQPDAAPVGADGRVSPPPHGWQGICPTHEGYRKFRMDAFRTLLRDFAIDGVWLDYHHSHASWERADPELPDTCFCERCLRRFREATGIRLPDAPTSVISKLLLSTHRQAWVRWRLNVFTDWVREFREILDATRPGALLGTFHNAWSDDDLDGARLNKLAIDLKAQAAYVDVFSPMLYHARFGHADDLDWIARQVSWLGRYLGIRGTAGERHRIWPIVQISDWGEPIVPVEQVPAVLALGARPPATGVLVFAWGGIRKSPEKIDAIGQAFGGR